MLMQNFSSVFLVNFVLIFFHSTILHVPAGRSVQFKLVETGRCRCLFSSCWLYFGLETSSGVTIAVFWSGSTSTRTALFVPSGLISLSSGGRRSRFFAVYRGDSGCFAGVPTIFVVVGTLRCVVSVFIYKC